MQLVFCFYHHLSSLLEDINLASEERTNILMIRSDLEHPLQEQKLAENTCNSIPFYFQLCAQRYQGSKVVFKAVSMSVFLSPHYSFCANLCKKITYVTQHSNSYSGTYLFQLESPSNTFIGRHLLTV